MSKRLIVTLLASLGLGSLASAASLLGTTTPFSKTALCKRVGCQVSGNAQVGGYLFVTYSAKDTRTGPGSQYFAFLKNGKTVAMGVYGLGSQDVSQAGNVTELKDLVALTGRPLPSLKGALEDPYGYASSDVEQVQVLRRDRNITLPLGGGMVLTNKSQRTALGNRPENVAQGGIHRFIDVAYVALADEVEPISRLINRWSPTEQRAARQAYLQAMGLRLACPVTQSNGKVVGINKIATYPASPWVTWALARGYTLNSNTFYAGLALPGLALSTIEIGSSGGQSMKEASVSPACIR